MGSDLFVTMMFVLAVLTGIYLLLKVVKGVFSLGMAIVMIMLLFRIGYVWTDEEMGLRLKLKEYLVEDYQEPYEEVVTDLHDRANKFMIIDTKKVYDDTSDALIDATRSVYELSASEIKQRVEDLSRQREE